MKSTLAFSQLLMLSTSLLCLSSFTTQNLSNESNVDLGANTLAEQSTGNRADQQKPLTNNRQTVKKCKTADNPYRVEVKHIEGKGVGYNQGYTSLDAFFTGNLYNFIPFVDLRAHVFNNGKWAANAGIGTRYVLDPCKSMVGINTYYDYRSTKHFHYNQVGAGIEAYYNRFEFLANGYLPVGRKRIRTSHELDAIDFKGFSGNYILYNKYYKNRYEGAMKGFNAEVGVHFAGDMKNFDLYFGVGPYYYDLHQGKHSWGGKARLKMELSRFFFVELSDSWDHIFHNRFQGSVNISIPFGSKKCYGQKRSPSGKTKNCSNIMDWLATLPVDRQEIIVVDKFKKDQTIDPVAIDPATGNPFYVVFVDNTNSNTGAGTFENPFSYLSDTDNPGVNAEAGSFPGNTIYVFAGDGTNAHMSTGMVLQESQRLLGSGIAHTYVTTDGVLVIPAQSGKTPFITGTVGAGAAPGVLIDANNCEVSGFNIGMQTALGSPNFTASTTPCIGVALDNSVTNVILTHNACVNTLYGMLIGSTTNATSIEGDMIITDNILSMHESSSAMSLGYGLQVQSSQNAAMLVKNNQITFNPTNNSGTTGGINITMLDQVEATVANNVINSVTGNGIELTWTNPTLAGITGSCLVQNNTLNNIGLAGFAVNSLAQTTTTGSIKAIVLGNTILKQGTATQFTTASTLVTNPGLLVRFNDNTIASTSTSTVVNFGTGTSATARLWIEPTERDTCNFTRTGTALIIPIVPCQYGGPGCP